MRLLTLDTNFRDFLPRTQIKKNSYTGHELKRLLTRDTNFDTCYPGHHFKNLLTQDTN